MHLKNIKTNKYENSRFFVVVRVYNWMDKNNCVCLLDYVFHM